MKPAVVVTLALVAALAVPRANRCRSVGAGECQRARHAILHQPATSGTHVAFVYADDLWVARLDSTDVRRLTTGDGVESNRRFAGWVLIAFSAQCDGNTDVYTVPAAGVPTRLTWHPGADVVQGFTPDGRRVALHLAALGLHEPLHAALHRAARRRHARSAAIPMPQRRLFARRAADGLQPDRAPLRTVEAISRWHGVAPVALRLLQPKRGEGAATGDTLQRGRDVDWRHPLLPIRSSR